MGLRLRVILILIIPAVMTVGAHGVLRVRQEEADLVRENRENLELMARAIQLAVENALRDQQLADVRRLLIDMVERQEQIDRIRLFDRQLRPTIVSNPLAIGESIPAGNLGEVMRTGHAESFYQRGKPSLLYYLAPVRGRDDSVEGVMEIVRLASAVDRRRTAAIVDVIVRLSILLVVIVVTTAIAMQRQVLRPLARLTEAIERLGRGPSSASLPVTRRDELGRVAESFNAMAQRLDGAQQKLLEETERAVGLERELRRTATLAVAGRLASALAHEVGTPLNIVSGRAEVVLKSLAESQPQRKDLQIIIAQIDRICRIIGSVLDVVRTHKPELRPTAVAEVIEELLPLLHHTARQKGVELTAASDADVPTVLADSAQLQQVLINLVLNGVEATPTDGRVDVTVQARKHQGRPGVAIAVRDTGSGIAPEHLSRLFEPFFTTKPRGQGTGLGLPICRDIVQGHGGDIAVESSVGTGTTMTVWLPESSAEAA
jgi:two-component system, NtrC family, sensor kinase